MNITGIVDGRGTGKTKKLIDIATEEHATIVCENPERMLSKLHAYGKSGIFVISYEDFFDTSSRPKREILH